MVRTFNETAKVYLSSFLPVPVYWSKYTHTQQWPCLRRGPVLEEIKAQLFDDLFLTFVAQRIYSTVGPFFNFGFPPREKKFNS